MTGVKASHFSSEDDLCHWCHVGRHEHCDGYAWCKEVAGLVSCCCQDDDGHDPDHGLVLA